MQAERSAGWEFAIDGYDAEYQRVHSALFALAGGGLGTSGGSLLVSAPAPRWMVASGVYDGEGPETELLPGPVLSGLAVGPADDSLRHALDLRSGVLHERVTVDGAPVEMQRFVSIARPGVVAVRTCFPNGVTRGGPALLAPEGRDVEEGRRGDASWMRVAGSTGAIVAAVREVRGEHCVDDFAAIVADSTAQPDPAAALDRLDAAVTAGFEVLLAEQHAAWEARWRAADVAIESEPELQLATRLALFHLMAAVPDTGEAAVGARGLSGTGYRGHVFWDADTYVLPFLAATHPASARAMLEYRIARLPAAQEAARARGLAGARFPWESARSGADVTPRMARDRAGHVVPIRTGQLEDHIVAEVAWAADHYVEWTGDEGFARGPGLTLLIETARFWASRVRIEPDGSAHIYGVIGPDEYHEPVDDSTFTNVMARWNLRRAADAVDTYAAEPHGVGSDEVERWRAVASAIVDGYDSETRIYEEFAGFYGLEPLIIAEAATRRPIAADLLLGRDRVCRAQVVKQADVVLLHHLVPEAVEPGTLQPNLDYYEPRTAHGSSLSPAIHAALFARVGDLDRARAALDLASRVDLEDLTGTTAGGLHVATMGGLWQALVFGFAGVRPHRNRLIVDPHVPPDWGALEVRVVFRGRAVRIRAEATRFSVAADAETPIAVGEAPFTVAPDGLQFRNRDSRWELIS